MDKRVAFLNDLSVLLDKYDVEIFCNDYGTMRFDLHFSDDDTHPDEGNDSIWLSGTYGESLGHCTAAIAKYSANEIEKGLKRDGR